MKQLTWLLKWILRAAIFFALLAFALNNQQDVSVHLLFGQAWQAPLVLVLLAAFALGLAAGVLAMLPRWLKQRHAARQLRRRSLTDSELALTTIQPPHES
ncbi:MAG: lipopolysaccharide assembly protein LapA domain-containing protein [Hylemonella sp.]|nr:lipopolysaccharide assembly protein LapA domain-containing protein [Hylemonella sp.]